ncbi:MAG TPA: DedA family protein [Rhodanobacter sp.]|jgi:membrane protein DedA with SNARE-associated domain|nr:DedA family protein [Rhodanobacter sp.]
MRIIIVPLRGKAADCRGGRRAQAFTRAKGIMAKTVMVLKEARGDLRDEPRPWARYHRPLPDASRLMVAKLFSLLAAAIIGLITRSGYLGIVLLMAIESACIPLPSEVIMPFSGYLVFKGNLVLWLVAVAGAVGCVLGSLVAYAVGAWGGRRLVERYGKYLLVSRKDLDLADRWFREHGGIIVFVGRLLPVVRTFIAFPAGVARMPIWRFCLYTFLGSLIWCWLLAWIGLKLGQHWDILGAWFHRFDAAILAVLLIAAGLYVWRHVRAIKDE